MQKTKIHFAKEFLNHYSAVELLTAIIYAQGHIDNSQRNSFSRIAFELANLISALSKAKDNADFANAVQFFEQSIDGTEALAQIAQAQACLPEHAYHRFSECAMAFADFISNIQNTELDNNHILKHIEHESTKDYH